MNKKKPISLYNPAFHQNPYDSFQRLQEDGEIHYVKFPSGVCGWLVTGYDAAIKTLKHPKIGKNHKLGNAHWRSLAAIMPEPQHTQLQSHLLHQDPPRHTALRDLVMEAFSASRIERFRERVTLIAQRLLKPLQNAGECDLISDFASKLPLLVLSEVIGLSDKHRALFKPVWCKVVQPVGPNDKGRAEYIALLAELQSFIDSIIDESRGGDTERLIVRLVAAYDEKKISRDELTSMLFQLLVAGQEPVTNQIGNAILALLQHPEQLTQLREGSTRIDRAITELLRYDGAFEISTWRFFPETTEWLGETIPAGDPVIVGLNAANRDSAQFGCPHQLDFTRERNKPLSFGYDHHHCPASSLARLELEVSIQAILAYLPNIQLACSEKELCWVNAVLARGLLTLPVKYTTGESDS
ncbi:cytochrome P450 [Vibrio lentus]|uniref:cytochrome P450 family protein n=1 Tax=Vibrio TaxID=662 RepID=UPI00030D8769|nr:MULTISPECIES: cytochrome P450 [Vibrio]OCH54219.1 cytochrome [Vibrio lentus]PMG70498.1 cytochrome [Vibrio lentus]PMI57221.1 cytochrome [Vibrio lentus]PMI81855.1 cytochrome [Vibrio lentus]PMI91644.1 cytochrome [Vibrio lentus]